MHAYIQVFSNEVYGINYDDEQNSINQYLYLNQYLTVYNV